MLALNEMSLVYKRLMVPATRRSEPGAGKGRSDLAVAVVFTSVDATVEALRTAGALANRLNARIDLLVPQIVPYHLPISSPPVLLDFTEKRFRVMASESPVETTVHIYLCRDRLEALIQVLRPNSLVVIGDGKSWWRTAENRMAKQLRRAGHEVIMVETE